MKLRSVAVVVGLFVSVLFSQSLFADTENRDAAKDEISKCINGFMEEQEKGYQGERYCENANNPILVARFYSPTSWKILEMSTNGGKLATAKVRIESSTKNGTPIRKTWSFLLSKTEKGWKISLVN